jgi:PKD repeat protein
MRKLWLTLPLLVALAAGCKSKAPVGPGVVKITESTTSTSTTTTTTSTIPAATEAKFTFSPLTPEVLQVVNFNASGSTPGSGRTIVSYDWDFGDGEAKSGIKVVHDYVVSGTYLVTLTVTDDQGKPTVFSQPITVRPILPAPPGT